MQQDQVYRHPRPAISQAVTLALTLALATFLAAGLALGTGGSFLGAPLAVALTADADTPSLKTASSPDGLPIGTAAAGSEVGACCHGTVVDCPADLSGDGVVDGQDLLVMLGAWGDCNDPNDCPADFNGDGVVNGQDLLVLLSAWGDCPGGDGCTIGSVSACESEGGYYLGADSACDECPEAMECPPGAVQEQEPCGETLNDGCNLDPPAFGNSLSCGDTVCGTAWALDGNRDSDWYPITIEEDTAITWSVEAPYPVEVRIMTQSCPPILFDSASGTNPTAEACLPPGDYALVVRPAFTSGLSCESELTEYVGTVGCESCTVPIGACCTPDNECQEVAALTCFNLDPEAQFFGDGSQCSEIDCPFGPPLGLCEGNCGEIGIPDTMGGFCHCESEFCMDFPDFCCPGFCTDCPEEELCDPLSVCEFATGDCCEQHTDVGCGNETCCELVCACDPTCCEDGWDVFCATQGPCSAAELCDQCTTEECPAVTCENNEGEPCGEALNNGCDVSDIVPPFQPIECGETICGNLWAAPTPDSPDGARDTDWFKLDLSNAAGPVEITWSVQASEPVTLFVLTPECPTEVIAEPVEGCSGSITLCLDPGEYILYVAPVALGGQPCPGFTYEATVTCDIEACPFGQCEGNCGGGFGTPDCDITFSCECYCDDECAVFGDCCPGICNDCPDCIGCPNGSGCN